MKIRTLILGSLLIAAGTAQAGRPLTVDDADVDEAGTGHLEAFYARQPGRSNTWTLAPAWSPVDGLELGAALTRDHSAATTTQGLSVKWRITPVLESGCNTGVSAGIVHSRSTGYDPVLNGLLTCNSAWGASHLNLGAVRGSGGPTLATWGLAHERPFGAVTVHVEAFGQRLSKPTFQVGARVLVTEKLQLDGTLGRSDGETLVSVGFLLPF